MPEGTVLNDKYQVGRLLGRGGMGVVMAAWHLQLDTQVALKFLTTTEPELVARFSREARAAAQIQSEHVARVLDVSTLANGAPFMVMEYLSGEDLSRALVRGPLQATDAVDYVLQACEAIAEAHALGIVHRDLKPANLFLAQRAHGQPIVKVLDFGISRGGTRGAPTLTRPGMLGSPQYMSPEQWTDSRAVDARSDIWSLGVVLYESLAGRRPFDGESFPTLFTTIVSEPAPPLPGRVPPGLAAAVMRCLEKDRANRFQDVASLAREIAGFGPASSRLSLERITRVGAIKRTLLAETAAEDAPAGSPGPGGASAGPPDGDDTARDPVARIGTEPTIPSEELRLGEPRAAGAPPPTAQPPPPARGETARPAPAPRPPSTLRARTIGLALAIAGASAVTAVALTRSSGKHDPRAAADAPRVEARAPAPVVPPTTPPTAPAAAAGAAGAHLAASTAGVAAEAPPAAREKPLAGGRHAEPGRARPGPRWSAECSRLLQRQSLGETLNADELAVYMRSCRR